NADRRTLAALEHFRRALVARYGGDPMLLMLAISETEGGALVARPAPAAPELALLQGDHWIPTGGRELRPWSGKAEARAFALSSLRTAPIQAWLDRWRAQPGHATDFVADYTVGHD